MVCEMDGLQRLQGQPLRHLTASQTNTIPILESAVRPQDWQTSPTRAECCSSHWILEADQLCPPPFTGLVQRDAECQRRALMQPLLVPAWGCDRQRGGAPGMSNSRFFLLSVIILYQIYYIFSKMLDTFIFCCKS